MPAIGAEAVAAVPACEAERCGKERRVIRVQQRHHRKGGSRVSGDILDRRKAWRFTVEAEE
jgi:hypothetical protein